MQSSITTKPQASHCPCLREANLTMCSWGIGWDSIRLNRVMVWVLLAAMKRQRLATWMCLGTWQRLTPMFYLSVCLKICLTSSPSFLQGFGLPSKTPPFLWIQHNPSYHASSHPCLFVLAVAFYPVIPLPCVFCSGSSPRTVFSIILLSITSHAFAYICQMCNPTNLHVLFHSKSPASAQVTTNPASSSMRSYHVQKHAQTAAFLLHPWPRISSTVRASIWHDLCQKGLK